MTLTRILLIGAVLAACSLIELTDPYGNTYGDWYNHGDLYTGQLAACEKQMNEKSVPLPDRKLAMRCCMWHSGVPIDDSQSCGAQTG